VDAAQNAGTVAVDKNARGTAIVCDDAFGVIEARRYPGEVAQDERMDAFVETTREGVRERSKRCMEGCRQENGVG
jgi:hypothetical protein